MNRKGGLWLVESHRKQALVEINDSKTPPVPFLLPMQMHLYSSNLEELLDEATENLHSEQARYNELLFSRC